MKEKLNRAVNSKGQTMLEVLLEDFEAKFIYDMSWITDKNRLKEPLEFLRKYLAN